MNEVEIIGRIYFCFAKMNVPPMEDYKYSILTGKIIGCAMKVHRVMGQGYPEAIYLRCLVIELTNAGLKYRKEVSKGIFYEDINVGSRRMDLLVEELVIVEAKATSQLEPRDYNQVLNYLRIFNFEVSLLLNFGNTSLQYKRFANTR